MEVGKEKIAARPRASLFNFAQKWYCGKPTRRSKSSKRGSQRKLSNPRFNFDEDHEHGAIRMSASAVTTSLVSVPVALESPTALVAASPSHASG
jgi:hypothetical protein